MALAISLLASGSEFEDTLINQQFEDAVLDLCVNYENLFRTVCLSIKDSKASAKRSRLFTIHSSTNVGHC